MGNSQSVPPGSKVVLVGAGFGGKDVAMMLDGVKGLDLTVIEKSSFIYNSIGSLRALVEPGFAHSICIPLDGLLKKGGKLVEDEVVSVSDTEVTCRSGKTFPFDICILATGSEYAFPFKAGDQGKKSKGTGGDKTLGFVNNLQQVARDIKSSQRICIVGGGAVGVEAAGEIKTDYPDKEVTLIHRHMNVISSGGWFKTGFSVKAQKNLEALGVNMVMGYTADISQAREKQTDYFKGETSFTCKLMPSAKGEAKVLGFTAPTEETVDITADLVFYCTGSTFKSARALDKDMAEVANEIGQYRVNEFLQVQGRPNLFAIGDCCATKDPKMALVAAEQGKTTAYNAIALLKKKASKMKAWNPKGPRMMVVTTGRKGGSAQLPMMGGKLMGSGFVKAIKGKDLFSGNVWGTFGASKAYKKAAAKNAAMKLTIKKLGK